MTAYSFTKLFESTDDAYMQAVGSGDMETAQRMVDEAAEAAGYMPSFIMNLDRDRYTPWMHGSRVDGFTEFTDPYGYYYFTDDEESAESFGGNRYDVLLKLGNAMYADGEGSDKYSIPFEGSKLDVEDVMFLAKDRGYDSVVIENVVDNAGNSPHAASVAIVFNPNQIKFDAPVTYDDQGKPIPLSQRFNQSSNDIRY